MSGTVRTPSSLMTTSLADNSSGDIGADDARDIVESLAAIPNQSSGPNYNTASVTIALTDRGTMVVMNSTGALNVNVPTNASVPFPINTRVYVFNYNTGVVTVQAVNPGTTTIRNSSSNTIRGQYSVACIWKLGTDEWVLFGDVS